MSFHFKLWPTILTSIMLFVLVALGSWQIQRLNWKNELITKIQTRAAERPVLLAKHPDNMEELEFQRVNVRGRFDHSTEFHLVNRSLNGNPGLHIITPFFIRWKVKDMKSRLTGCQVSSDLFYRLTIRWGEAPPISRLQDRLH